MNREGDIAVAGGYHMVRNSLLANVEIQRNTDNICLQTAFKVHKARSTHRNQRSLHLHRLPCSDERCTRGLQRAEMSVGCCGRK